MRRGLILMFFLLFAFTDLIRAQSKETEIVLSYLSRWDNDKLTHAGTQTFNDIWGWTSPDHREYAIIGSLDSIYFIEVTHPYKPQIRAVHAGRFNLCSHRDFKTLGKYCYAVADEGPSSLQIFDLSFLPDSVHKVYDNDSLVTRSHNIFIENNRLYLADHKQIDTSIHSITRYPLTVLSLDDPEKPYLLNHLKAPLINSQPAFNVAHDVHVRHDTAYCSVENAGLYIYDYRDALNPKLIQTITPPYPDNGYNHSSWLSDDGNTLVFADETHYKRLKAYDVRPIKKPIPKEPEFKSLMGFNNQFSSIVHNPFIKGSYVYVSYYHDGVVVFNIANPDSTYYVTHYDTFYQNDTCGSGDMVDINCLTNAHKGFEGCWGVYPFLPSGTIIASDMTNGLYVLRLDTFTVYPKPVELNVKPNPFRESFVLTINANKEQVVNTEIYDMLGHLIELSQIEVPRGTSENLFALPNYTRNGLYILKATAAGETFTYKLSKI